MVIAEPGSDGSDRGARAVALALRDAGMEVIWTGLHQTAEQIVETVVQEDADAVGVALHPGADLGVLSRLPALLGERDVDDVIVFAGGDVPAGELPQGVARVFAPGVGPAEIVDWVRSTVGS